MSKIILGITYYTEVKEIRIPLLNTLSKCISEHIWLHDWMQDTAISRKCMGEGNKEAIPCTEHTEYCGTFFYFRKSIHDTAQTE